MENKQLNKAWEETFKRFAEKEDIFTKHNIAIRDENGDFLPLPAIIFQLNLYWDEIKNDL